MSVRVVMELGGDNDGLHEKIMTKIVRMMEDGVGIPESGHSDRYYSPKSTVESCIITTGEVTVEEVVDGQTVGRRPQRIVR